VADYKDLPDAPGFWMKFYKGEWQGLHRIVIAEEGPSTIWKDKPAPLEALEGMRWYGPLPRDEQAEVKE
jgi:hypothetical protein